MYDPKSELKVLHFSLLFYLVKKIGKLVKSRPLHSEFIIDDLKALGVRVSEVSLAKAIDKLISMDLLRKEQDKDNKYRYQLHPDFGFNGIHTHSYWSKVTDDWNGVENDFLPPGEDGEVKAVKVKKEELPPLSPPDNSIELIEEAFSTKDPIFIGPVLAAFRKHNYSIEEIEKLKYRSKAQLNMFFKMFNEADSEEERDKIVRRFKTNAKYNFKTLRSRTRERTS